MTNNISVDVRSARKVYDATSGTVVALDSVSVQIRKGEFFTLLGPSGCGKTTLLRLIAGFESPTAGEILLNGTDISGKPPFERPVNTVFQSYALFPHLTVRQNISFGLEMLGRPKDEVARKTDEVLELVKMTAMADRKPQQLSGGQQQRVALARALAPEPEVLLLDEPLSALDLKLRKEMQHELKRLQLETGITFIFVTHDQEEALAMSDRVAVINEGRVEQIGTVHEIYYQPATRFVASFIGETNIIQAEVIGTDATHTLCRLEGGLPLHIPISPTPIGTKILLSLRPEKIRLHRADSGVMNSFPARIAMEVFKGAVDDLTLVTQGGLELRALLANHGQTELDFHEGEPAFACIQPEDINIIQA